MINTAYAVSASLSKGCIIYFIEPTLPERRLFLVKTANHDGIYAASGMALLDSKFSIIDTTYAVSARAVTGCVSLKDLTELRLRCSLSQGSLK
jgi:hypothetical protein